MPVLSLLLHLVWCAVLASGPYQAIVVDATTSQPIAGVSFQDMKTHTDGKTNQRGEFTLSGPTAHFRLQCLGYAPLEATRTVPATGRPDTIRLLPLALVLPEVSVQPNPTITLAGIGPKAVEQSGTLVVPGIQFGMLFRPPASSSPSLVEQLVIRWSPNHPTAGRVRIRLVAVQADSLRPVPSTHDLVPFAEIYTAAQLAALPSQLLRIDLTAYAVRLPPEGLYILIEGLPTDPAEVAVAMQKDDPTPWQRITATDPQNPATYQRTLASSFPALCSAESISTAQTLVREFYTRQWCIRETSHKKKVANLDLSLIIRAQ